MEIDFNKYRPAFIRVQAKKVSRTGIYRYTVSRKRFEELIDKAQGSDITIKELKEILGSLKYIEDSQKVADILNKIKISSKSTVDKDLTLCFYMFYLDFYSRPDNDGIFWSVTQLGKRCYTYMDDSTKNIFERNFQRLFGARVNKSFDVFLKEEFAKTMGLSIFSFCEDFLIDYDSDILTSLLDDYVKKNKKLGERAQGNIKKLQHKIDLARGIKDEETDAEPSVDDSEIDEEKEESVE